MTCSTPPRRRRSNRLHLFYVLLDVLDDRQWFSAYQFAQALYYGRGRPHSQQLRRVREHLDASMARGELIRDDTVAACPLYRGVSVATRGSTGWCFHIMSTCYPDEWDDDQLTAMTLAAADADRFIPHTPDVTAYTDDGRLPVPPPTPDPHNPYPLADLP